MEIRQHSRIYGFEDYKIVSLNERCFYFTWGEYHIPYFFDNFNCTYIIDKNLPIRVSNITHPKYAFMNQVCFHPDICINHKELLEKAKKIYTHPNCKLSRSMMAEKYKKSLNPFLSDAVIVPQPDYDSLCLDKTALFINEQSKIIVRIEIQDEKAEGVIKKAEGGDKLGNLTVCPPRYREARPFSVEDVTEAELFYFGDVLYIPGNQSFIAELITNSLPLDKIVFEECVQDSLGDENNKVDFESLCSIKEMLDSCDENTVGVGLKALSVMDWMHYPNSVKYIMNQTDKYKWLYNKASNSTSVKYMLSTISDSKARRHWPGNYDNDIYEQDFELFKQLKMHYEKISNDDILTEIKFMNFIRCNAEGKLVPNLRMSI